MHGHGPIRSSEHPSTIDSPLVANSNISLPGCDGKAQLAFHLGVPTVSCPSFSVPAINTGAGCAAGIGGTLTIRSASGTEVGAANWTYASTVRSGQQFIITGGPIVVPTNSQYWAYPTFYWNNVAC
jgi:hypothetical protein